MEPSVQDFAQQGVGSSLELLHLLPQGVISQTADGRITAANKTAQDILGLTLDQLLGVTSYDPTWHAITHDGFPLSGENHPAMRALRSGQPTLNVVFGISKPNSVFSWLDASSVPFKNPQSGKIQGVYTVFTDITEKKRIQNELESTLESLGDAFFSLDADWRYIYVNAEAQRLMGFSLEELAGKTFWQTFPAVVGSTLESSYRKAAAGEMQDFENYYMPWDRWFRNRCFPRRGGGMSVHFVDISERKLNEKKLLEQNEELRRAKDAADQANKAKSQFLSGMSDELRTPLNAVLGFAQLLETANPPLAPQQQLAVEQILKAGWHLLKMVDEVLDLSLIESGGVHLAEELVSIANVIQDCRSMTESLAKYHGIQTIYPHLNASIIVKADPTRLKQSLVNLLTNAIKYNRVGGTVNVDCRLTETGSVRIHVKDNGLGLRADQVANLFQTFNRLGQETSNTEGSGIGLVVTKQLVELMGGTVGVHSTQGVGSDFWLAFDIVNPMQSDGEVLVSDDLHKVKSVGNLADGEMRTILYVEDNAANLLLIEGLVFQRNDLVLITATDAFAGIELARSKQPDLILLDINLPGMNGYDALQILQQDSRTAHIIVLGISASAMPSDVEKGQAAGFFRYVTKPIKLEEFSQILNLALNHIQ